jgi:GTP cyclohydrolase I
MCVEMRGVNETHSVTETAYFGGQFKEDRDLRKELLMCIQS